LLVASLLPALLRKVFRLTTLVASLYRLIIFACEIVEYGLKIVAPQEPSLNLLKYVGEVVKFAISINREYKLGFPPSFTKVKTISWGPGIEQFI
jgi:hypothetical protein